MQGDNPELGKIAIPEALGLPLHGLGFVVGAFKRSSREKSNHLA
jgi:hypothetical protein